MPSRREGVSCASRIREVLENARGPATHGKREAKTSAKAASGPNRSSRRSAAVETCHARSSRVVTSTSRSGPKVRRLVDLEVAGRCGAAEAAARLRERTSATRLAGASAQAAMPRSSTTSTRMVSSMPRSTTRSCSSVRNGKHPSGCALGTLRDPGPARDSRKQRRPRSRSTKDRGRRLLMRFGPPLPAKIKSGCVLIICLFRSPRHHSHSQEAKSARSRRPTVGTSQISTQSETNGSPSRRRSAGGSAGRGGRRSSAILHGANLLPDRSLRDGRVLGPYGVPADTLSHRSSERSAHAPAAPPPDDACARRAAPGALQRPASRQRRHRKPVELR